VKKTQVIILALSLLCLLSSVCFAVEEAAAVPSKGGSNVLYYALAALGCGVGIGLGAIGSGIGMGIGTSKACEGIARNPGTTGKITTTLIIGLALMESLTIYALVVVLIVLFVNPFGKLLQF